MEIKVRRTTFPSAMREAVTAHAAAIVAGDVQGASRGVDAAAQDAFSGVIARLAGLGQLKEYEVLAEARLGLQFIVKVRYHGAKRDSTVQYRWAATNDAPSRTDPAWRIVDLEDLAVRSPWLKPIEPEIAKSANAQAEGRNG